MNAIVASDQVSDDALSRAAKARKSLLSSEERPPRSCVNSEGIPSEIKQLHRWVCWQWRRNKSKWTKAPVKTDDSSASSTNDETWASFDEVMDAYQRNDRMAGVGFVLGDGYVGVDLDSCYDPVTDEADGIIHEVTSRLDSYTEVSPSGTGVKILVKGELPQGKRQSPAELKHDVECYQVGRYFTITGNRWDETPDSISEATAELAWFHQTYVDPPRKQPEKQTKSGTFNAESTDVDKGREAISNIHSSYADAYGDWINVGMAAKSCGEELFQDWVQWSSGSSKFEGEGDCRAKWESFKGRPTGEVGIATLVKLGKQNGWIPSWAGKSSASKKDRSQDVTEPEEQLPKIETVSVGALIESHPELRPPVVDGILRRAEIANFIAASKVGKSFLASGLAWSVATGTPWLGHSVAEGRVLIIDNELHPETLASRLYRVATDMMIDVRDYPNAIEVASLRGDNTNIHGLGARLQDIEPRRYALVVIDALYRTFPDGTSENDNAATMAIYNQLDFYAKQWDSAIAVVHHASKGQQGEKSITDVGTGAGSISRAADTHLVIRPHEEEGLSVLDCVTRSFKSPEPKSIKFEWPLWSIVGTAPEVKKAGRQSREEQERTDRKEAAEILQKIPTAPKMIQQARLFEKFGHGEGKMRRLLGKLVEQSEVTIRRRTKKGRKRATIFYTRPEGSSGNSSGCSSDSISPEEETPAPVM